MSFLFDLEPPETVVGFVPFKVDWTAFEFAMSVIDGMPLGKASNLSCLPFDKTWFELSNGPFVAVFKAQNLNENQARALPELSEYTKWEGFKRCIIFDVWKTDTKRVRVVIVDDSSDVITVATLQDWTDTERFTVVTQLFGLCLLLNSRDVVEHEHHDMTKIDKARRARGTGIAHSFTRLKLSLIAREWFLHKSTPIYKDERGQHWVRRHPSVYWTKNETGEPKAVVLFRGPFKRGNPEYGEREARYVVR